MDIRVNPSFFSGNIKIPPSKSAAHRAAICAALSSCQSRLSPIEATNDMLATINAANALGAKTELVGSELRISGGDAHASATIDCGESGSTLRFFVPIAAALGVNASFYGHGRLPKRPIDELVRVLTEHGVRINPGKSETEILTCQGKLEAGIYEIGGDISSQYITGLLFALPLLDGDSEIVLTTGLESRSYVDMTVFELNRFGVRVSETARGFKVCGGQTYRFKASGDKAENLVNIEGDYSSAAFWFCAAAIGGKISVAGLGLDSKQGDKRILQLLSDMGAHVKYERDFISVERGALNAFDTDVSQIPDLMPILAVTAAFSNGTGRLYNARRLRLKESDRISTVAAGLRELGVSVVEKDDELIVTGQKQPCGGGVIDSAGDHRIAMSMSIASAFCRKPTVIRGAECVDKSYPVFYKDFTDLGGAHDVL